MQAEAEAAEEAARQAQLNVMEMRAQAAHSPTEAARLRAEAAAAAQSPIRAAPGADGADGMVHVDATIKAVFDRFDVNQSGRLDYRELRTCLRALGLDVTSREAAEMLLTYDSDANGLMELLEFARLVHQLGYRPHPAAQPGGDGMVRIDATIKAVFDRFDVNQSGRLDYRELRTCLRALGMDVTRHEAAEVLLSYDSDANGLMELLEFARLVHRLGYRPQPHAQQPGPPLLGAPAGYGRYVYIREREASPLGIPPPVYIHPTLHPPPCRYARPIHAPRPSSSHHRQ
jgi:Ca2+-binding EF-hand superfamily protein